MARLGLAVFPLTRELAELLGYQDLRGLLVVEIEAGGLAARAGVHPKDLILSVGDTSTPDVDRFVAEVRQHDLRQGIRMQVLRDGVRAFVFLGPLEPNLP